MAATLSAHWCQPSILDHAVIGSSWDAGGPDGGIRAHHLEEWTRDSGIEPELARLALESIAGEEAVLSFLAPTRLGRAGGYATLSVRNARRTFAGPIRGGWTAIGLHFLDSRPTPTTFKPDHPRLDPQKGRPIKYERPAGQRAIPYFPPLPPAVVERICARSSITPPPEPLDPWTEAWNYLLSHGAALHIDEGEKKAASGCSAGFLTVGLAGIWNGCPKAKDASGVAFGGHVLIPELAATASGRRVVIGFDNSESPRGRNAIRNAIRTLGRLLEQAGATVAVRPELPTAPGGAFIKGTDDLIVAMGTEALVATLEHAMVLDEWITSTAAAAVRAHILEPFEARGRYVRRVGRHFRATDIPSSKLVAVIGGMGSNKTGALAELTAAGTTVFPLTHRRSLTDQAAIRLGVPIKREGAISWPGQAKDFLRPLEPEAHAPQWAEQVLASATGFATVLDSSYIGGSGELNPSDLAGHVLAIDEADAVLLAALAGGTAVTAHRDAVLANLRACCAAAGQVVLLGAHLDELTLDAFEAMTGAKAHILTTSFKPAAGRQAAILRTASDWLEQLRSYCLDQQPVLIHTSSKRDGKLAATVLSRQASKWWPDARILVLTADTIREKNHPAAHAISYPETLCNWDVVIASPVLETGFSIEDPDHHFRAVFASTAGHTSPQAFTQSIGRLRSPVPRFLLATSNGVGNAIPGTSGVWADEVRTNNDQAELALRRAGFLSAAEQDRADGAGLDFYRLWASTVARQNWLASKYRESTAAFLEAEGYDVLRFDQEASCAPSDAFDEITDTREEITAEENTEVASAIRLEPEQRDRLRERRRLSRAERASLNRATLEQQLGIVEPSAEQVGAHRSGAYAQLLMRHLVSDSTARQAHAEAINRHAPPGRQACPQDRVALQRHALRAMALEHIDVGRFLAMAGTGERFVTGCPELEGLRANLMKWKPGQVKLAFGITVTEKTTATTITRHVLRAIGLELKRCGQVRGSGDRRWTYAVEELHQSLPLAAVMAHIRATHLEQVAQSFQ